MVAAVDARLGLAPMLEPFDAAARIIASLAPLDAIELPLGASDGLVLADDVTSPVTIPPWPSSAMDGYACRAADLGAIRSDAPVVLRVVGQVRAGATAATAVGPGEAIRIATGAPVPSGADSVVRIEHTDHGMEIVRIVTAQDARRNVRIPGEDIRAHEIAIPAGTSLGPAQITLLAAIGAATVRVHRRPRIAILATGDELVPLEQFDEVLASRRIVSSNSYGLAAAVRSAGGDPVDFGIVADDPGLIRDTLRRAAECDMVLTSAGVSVGDADHVRDVVAELGGRINFRGVRMRPGSPFTFGTIGRTPWLGLPGNPVSTLVTFEFFGRPGIRRLKGCRDVSVPRLRVSARDSISLPGGMMYLLRVRLTWDGGTLPRAQLTTSRKSGALSSLALADALMIVPAGCSEIGEGDVLEAMVLPGRFQFTQAVGSGD